MFPSYSTENHKNEPSNPQYPPPLPAALALTNIWITDIGVVFVWIEHSENEFSVDFSFERYVRKVTAQSGGLIQKQ